MHVVYVIQHTETKTLYVGKTSNLIRRLKEHNQNQNYSTRRKEGEWILIYAEAYRDQQDASDRETKLKERGSAKQKLRKRIKRSLLEIKS